VRHGMCELMHGMAGERHGRGMGTACYVCESALKMQLYGTTHLATGSYRRFKGTTPLRNVGRHSVTSGREESSATRLDEHSVYTSLMQLLTLNTAKCQAHSLVVGRVRFTL
jgi:hypothetical protein